MSQSANYTNHVKICVLTIALFSGKDLCKDEFMEPRFKWTGWYCTSAAEDLHSRPVVREHQ